MNRTFNRARGPWFALLALLACWPYLSTAGAQNDFRDAQVLDHYESVARRTVLEYGQLPLWNPYSCGGLYALGSPQTRFASPTFAATLAFGASRATAVMQWLLVLLALEGTYRCLRAHRVRPQAAVLAAPIFGLSGIFACAPFLGWVSFCGFAGLPWAVWGTQQALRGRRWGVLLTAGTLAAMTGFGGTYTAPITVLACATVFIGPLARFRFQRIATVAAQLALATSGLAMFRLLPIFETLRQAPRAVAALEKHSLPELGGLLFGTAAPFSGPECWYLVGAPAACVAAFELLHRRAWWLVAALALGGWVAMGQAVTPSLFLGLRQLPAFTMLRSPERFLVPVALIFALGAGRAMTSFAARARKDRRFAWVQRLAVLTMLFNAAMQIFNFEVAAKARTLVAPPVEIAQPFHQARGNRWAVTDFGAMNRGSLSCWEAYPVPQSRLLRPDATEELWLEQPERGRVEQTRWSPNVLGAHAVLAAPARVVINQNHHVGWRASVGAVANHHGLLAVDLPAGAHQLELTFRPRSAVVGLTVSALMLLSLLVLTFGSTRWWLAMLAGPLIIGAAGWRVLDEPTPTHELRDLEDAPVIADTPPSDAPAMGVDFEGGVRLQAARATLIADNLARLELDWVVPQKSAKTLGVFVHLEPEGGKSISADHPMISGVLAFEDLPPGKTGRDVVLISVPPEARGKRISVWAGLWALRGDGARMQVLSSTSHRVDSNRLLVATVTPAP